MSERPNTDRETVGRDLTADDGTKPAAAENDEERQIDGVVEGENGLDQENTLAELEVQRIEHQALHDKYVRLFAEFDNFRKRTAKERLELIQFAGEQTLQAVLPILDDLERAMVNNEKVNDIETVKKGFELIQQKFTHILSAQGLKPMSDAKGKPFDTDHHEAITKAPAPSEDLKGKVIEVVENGYTLHDKVIRYAKVVVGE